MSTTPSGNPPAPPAWKPLDPGQRRVLGVLIEKGKTTPGAYPMTVNAIVTGSNQKNNRDPLTSLDDFDVEKALSELTSMGAASEIDWMGRVPKYKHHAYEWLGVNKVELAVMGELLLRGAQALGELRARAARMEPIADLAALTPIVAGLVERGLMLELTPAGRGQMVTHNLYLPNERAELTGRRAVPSHEAGRVADEETPAYRASAAPLPGTPATGAASSPAVTELVVAMRAEMESLRARVAALEARLPPAND